jgi:hypothetical protein
MKKKQIIIFSSLVVVALITILVWTLWPKSDRKNQISNIELKQKQKDIEISILRYDQDVFQIDLNNSSQDVLKLSQKYPPYLIDEKICTNPEMLEMLKRYLSDPVIIDIYNQVQKLFPNFNQFEPELLQALSYYLVYFPDEKIPQMITIIPGIDLQMPSIYIYDNIIYINLDMYLGSLCSHYNKLGVPKYISERYDQNYLLVDLFKKAFVYKHLPEQEPITLLEHMIVEGKKLYFTEMMLPKTKQEDIIGYSIEKFKWAETFYPNVWGYLVENNLLFSKEKDPVRKYIEEAPFSKPFGNQSPGRIGQFLGWKIVKAYMSNNPDVTLENLMKTTDLQLILNKSAFKPVIKK